MLYFHYLAIHCKQLDRSANWPRHLSSAEEYTNMSYYNLCGIRSQHSNISKGKKRRGTYKKKIRLMQDYDSHDRHE